MPLINPVQGIRPGFIAHYAANAIPNGWLKANGAIVSRATYAALFQAIGTAYGAGDGSTTFALPDARGEFLRGLDDGRGVDAGRALGSVQLDAMQNVTGSFSNYEEPFGAGTGIFAAGPAGTRFYGGTSINAAASMTFDASRVARTASENRPRNVAMLACIKF